ncbi:MAG: hypothetical protein L3K09_04400 [Thermoplasmata archaeon]|nr:hypothetical protein [Thermoplasmata archaeon]
MSAPPPRRHSAEPETVEPCLVAGCGQPSVRHLALAAARQVFKELPEKGHRAPLCKEHYKAWKKATKQARVLDRATW